MHEQHDRSGGSAPRGSARAVASPGNRTTRRASLYALLRPAADDAQVVADAPRMTIRQVARRFWPQVRPLRWWMLLGLLLSAGISAIGVAEIALFARVVDDVLVPADLGLLPWIALAYLGLSLGSGLLSGCKDYLSTWVSQGFLLRLRTQVFRHVLSLPQDAHDRRRLGDVLSRLTSDVSSVEQFMVSALSRGAAAVITVLFYVGALFWLDPLLAAVSMLVVPVFAGVAAQFSRLVKEAARERRRRGGSLSAVAEENLGNVPLVQAFGRQDDAVAKFQRENAGIMGADLASSRVRSVFLPVVDLAELAGILSVIAMGTWALSEDRLSLGQLIAFLTLMAQLYRPLRDLASLLPTLHSATAGIERLVELLDDRPPPESPHAVRLDAARGELSLRGVRVTYPGAQRSALDGLDLTVAPGQVVAVVGPSGAGKSTLVKALLRLLDPDAGVVCLDGYDLRDLRLDSLRDAVSVVPQETLLLDTSVHDNIAFARPDATRDEVVAAARAADADEFVQRLPLGYDTPVGQRARTLSGGQRQRVAIARALLRDSPVLILDEPTTGLDTETAQRVLEPLRRLTSGRTTVLVTHDPVAVSIADRVLTLVDGRLVADPVEVPA